MTEQTSTTNSSSQTQPWTPQIPFIEQGLGAAGNAFSQTQGNAGNPFYSAPTQFTAGNTPGQNASYQAMLSYGLNPNNPAASMVGPST